MAIIGSAPGAPLAAESGAARIGDALAFWAVVGFGLILLFASSWIPAARNLSALTEQERLVLEEIAILERENARLEARLNGLYSDPYYLERVMRGEHGYAGDGEVPLQAHERSAQPGRADR